MTESELAVNTKTPQPSPNNNDTSISIMNLKNKFDTIRLENKINNDKKEKREFSEKLKDVESGPISCDLCDFETAISATGKNYYINSAREKRKIFFKIDNLYNDY